MRPPARPHRSNRLLVLLAGLVTLGFATPSLEASESDLRLAKDFFAANRYQDAWSSVQAALRDDPGSVEANYYAGLIQLESQKLPVARQFFLTALEHDPLHQDAAEKAVETLRAEARGSMARAQAAFEFPIRKYEIYLGPLVLDLFKVYLSSNDHVRLLRVAEKLVEEVRAGEYLRTYGREGSEALVLAARVAYQRGEMADAQRFLDTARTLHGGVEGLADLSQRIRDELIRRATPAKEEGDTQALRGEYAEALIAYKRSLDVYPGWQEVKTSILSVANLQEAERLFAEARELEEKGDEGAALRKYNLALEKTPEDPRLKNRIQDLRERMQERRSAVVAREEVRKRTERAQRANFAAAFERGEAAVMNEQWIDAEEAYQEALRLFPDDESVKEKLARVADKAALQRKFAAAVKLFKQQKHEQALRGFQGIAEEDSTFPHLQRFLALCYFHTGRHEDAAVAAQQYLDKVQRSKEMFYLLGVIHHQKVIDGEEGPGTAIRWLEKVDDEYYEDTGKRLEDLRWRRNRIPFLVTAAAVVLWLAALFWKKKRPEILKNSFLGKVERYAAREKWDALAKLEPEAMNHVLDRNQDLAVCTALAQAFYQRQDYQKAINWGTRALALARENPNMILLMGRIYFEGRIISQEVLRYLLALSNQEPDNLELSKFIGEFCLEKQVLNDDTMPILRNLAMAMPEHDKLRRMLIRGYLRGADKSARAMALYRVELEKDPENVDLRYMVAYDCMKSGRTEECIKHCEKVINVKLNHVPTHDLLRQAYGKLGKIDELARIYQAILESDPYNPAVQDSLKKILSPDQAGAPQAGGAAEGPKNCPKCGHTVQVGQYYCVCGNPV